jgi:hypothetical protein
VEIRDEAIVPAAETVEISLRGGVGAREPRGFFHIVRRNLQRVRCKLSHSFQKILKAREQGGAAPMRFDIERRPQTGGEARRVAHLRVVAALQPRSQFLARLGREVVKDVARHNEEVDDLCRLFPFRAVAPADELGIAADRLQKEADRIAGVGGLVEEGPELRGHHAQVAMIEQKHDGVPEDLLHAGMEGGGPRSPRWGAPGRKTGRAPDFGMAAAWAAQHVGAAERAGQKRAKELQNLAYRVEEQRVEDHPPDAPPAPEHGSPRPFEFQVCLLLPYMALQGSGSALGCSERIFVEEFCAPLSHCPRGHSYSRISPTLSSASRMPRTLACSPNPSARH